MTRAMKYQLAGLLCAAFAITTLVGSIIASIFTGGFMIDFGFLIVICLAAGVVEGSPRAARWCVAVMSLYCLVALSLILGAWFWPERIRIGNRPMSAGDLPCLVAVCGVLVIWSGSCIVCLLRALRSSSPERRSSSGAAVTGSA